MKLQLRILLPIIALMVVLMGVSSYLSYSQASDNLRTALIDNMKGEAHAMKRATHDLMQSAVLTIERTAMNADVVDLFSSGKLQDKAFVNKVNNDLHLLAKLYPDFSRVSILDASGVTVASSEPARVGLKYDTRNYFIEAKKGKAFLSSPFITTSMGTREVMIAASAPIKLGDKVVGVIFGSIILDNYNNLVVKPIAVGKDGFAYVLDQNGLIVVHKDASYVLKDDLPAIATYKEMVNGAGDTHVTLLGNNGEETILYYVKEPYSSLTMVVRADAADVFSGLQLMAKTSIGVASIATVLGILLVVLLVRPIVNALNRGVTFAERIAAGDLRGELDIDRNDEIGQLANSLRSIPQVLNEIVDEYAILAKSVETGNLNAVGDAHRFSGDFAHLIEGTNNILERFRTVIDYIPSPVVMLDNNLKAIYINPVSQNLVGKDYKGKTCQELFGREDYGTPACAMQRSLQSGMPETAETRAHPGGRVMDISYTSIPMKNAAGQITAMLQCITDLTEIKGTQRTIMEVASQAQDISNRVATAAEELSSQVEEVNKGTGVQRDRAASTATAMEEMNATVLEVARNAGQASEQANATSAKATEGSDLVNQVIEAIRQVHEVASDVQVNMQELGKQAEAIGGVMNVISDIADQTNLLALNAAIEAARAGDAGRGFAVVADEVRKLAEKTMSATTEVGASIKGIQTATATNIHRVGDAADGVGKATELASTSGEALQEILELVSANSALISGIATAAEEQSATSEEINQSVEEINSIAGDTARGMEQSAAAVQELSRMAQELRVLLDRLRG